MIGVRALTLAGAMSVLTVSAVDRTWDGNGGVGNVNWSTANNWDGDVTAPVNGDALVFGGTAKLVNSNDFSGGVFSGITFANGAGAFTLRGSAVTLDGNVTNFDADTQTISLPLVLSGTRDVTASNGAITVGSAISGSGGLNKYGSKMLTLSASNSYEGVTLVGNGTLAITHGNALGSTNGNTVVTCAAGGYFQLSGGISVAEPITLSGERPGGLGGGSILNSSGSNTLFGPLTMSGTIRTKVDSGTLAVKGGVLKAGSSVSWLILNALGTIAFYDTPLNIGNNVFFCNVTGGQAVLGVTGNVWGETWLLSGTLRMGITNALPLSAPLVVGNSMQADGIMDLNGYDQTVCQLLGPTPDKVANGYLTSTRPATLTVDQSVSTLYNRPLYGMLGLRKIGAGTLTLSNSLSTTTGDITVTNGTLVVAIASSLGSSTNVTVAGAAATLELKTASGIADTASLNIAGGGIVKIGADLVEAVDKLYLDGEQKQRGTWGATGSGAAHIDDAHFFGSGKLLVVSDPPVTPVDALWDAEGADTLLSTTNNWAGDVLPAFDGTTYAKFGTGGNTATVDRAVSLFGMAFNRDGNFTVAAGEGVITNGAGGILAAVPNTTSRTYTLAEDLTVAANQVWNFTNNGAGAATLAVSGSISSDNSVYPFSLTKAGNGTLLLSGSNTYEGVTAVANGTLEISSASALGSTNGNTVVTCTSGGCLQFSGGITTDEPITFSGERPSWQSSFLNRAGSNTLNGLVTTIGGIRTGVNGGTVLVFRGGVTNGSGGSYGMVLNSSGTLAFYDKPLNLGSNTFFCNPAIGGGVVVLGVAGNVWSNTELYSGLLRLEAVNALPYFAPLKVGLPAQADGILDLNGYNQTVCRLEGPPVGKVGSGYLTSTKPATLTVDQSGSTLYNRPLNGFLSLVKTGTGTLTLSNELNTTTGDITVSNGTLVVAVASNLGNSTNVTVAAGTLTLQSSSAIADTADLNIADGGEAKVSLAAGVNETVSRLYCGGKQRSKGTYSAAAAPGVLVVDTVHFAGTGVLTVLHDRTGTLIGLH